MNEIVIALIGSGALSALVSGAVTLIGKRIDRKNAKDDEKEALHALLLAMARSQIKRECREHIERGSISTDELEDIQFLHKYYKDAGGNGYCKTLMDKVNVLPIKEV